ncbi:MAG: polyprenyl synthetase family protein [Betaproteobacteria bacterium AqS2]|uniref:Polyprenyl synthetase family protein n=1 Tax=Candidatus Amphirhobacter heronislandensis TaxID=1732024 RepID=A0A930Y1A8_9GAMM|nr:polyprenyl synthetase family protein [Betaproteobacteria bacterium AqS2]
MADDGGWRRWRRQAARDVDEELRALLPRDRSLLAQSMRYATLRAGKRLRPLLYLATAADLGAPRPDLRLACALELVHSYSLIHDDLPCMDDDRMRRGQPACHVRFGEGMALLAGDALLTLAFAAASATGNAADAALLAAAAGHDGMVKGQALDIADAAGTLPKLRAMHQLKTGRLIEAAFMLGAAAARARAARRAQVQRLASAFGVCFQIANDIKDRTGTLKDTGKRPGGDRKRGRRTYVTVLGLGQAEERYRAERAVLQDELAKLPAGGQRLAQLSAALLPAA